MLTIDQDLQQESVSEAPTAPSSHEARLANAATALLGCKTPGEVYRVVGRFITRICSPCLAIVNEMSPEGDCFITREVAGLDESLMARAVKLAGFQIIDKESIIVPEYRYAMTHGALSKVEGGFAEFASSEVPRWIGTMGARLAGIREVYTIGIAEEDQALGNIHICTRSESAVVPAPIIEQFVRHAFSALAGLAIARDLEESTERFRLAVQTTIDGFWTFDTAGRLIDVNQAYCRMSGYSESELMGMDIAELDVGGSPAHIDARNQAVMARGHESFESVHRRKDGSLYYVEVSKSFMPANGGNFTCFIRDITERKRAQDAVMRMNAELEERVQARTEELTATNEELREANAELEEATRAKSDFLASMSHELRTPLNSIIGFSSILLQGLAGPVNAEQKRQLSMVSNSGHHLLALISDILDLSKIESGATVASPQRFAVHELAEDTLAMIRPLASEKGLGLGLECERCSRRIESDPRFVTQILINLLGNAVKFTDSGTVSLRVSSDGGDIVFDVIDTGRGIAASEIPHIMESFYQVGAVDEAKSAGTGLGLAVSSKLAQMLGGSLTATSELGVGSTFTLRIPDR